MEIVRKKEFTVAVFDLDDEIFIVYIAFLTSPNQDLEVHLFQKA